MPNVPYQTYSREQWQQIMQGAVHAHDLNAVRDAAEALNQYGQESLQASSPSSIPGELNAVATGIGKGVLAIPGGLKALGSQLSQGDITGAAKSVIGGLGSLGKGIAGAVSVGADAMSQSRPEGEYMPESQRLKLLEGAGETLAPLGVGAAVEGPIKGAIKNAAGGVLTGTLGRLVNAIKGVTPDAAEASGEAAQAGAAGPAGGSPQPLTDAARAMSDAELARQPMGQTPPVEQSFGGPGNIERRSSQAVDKMLGRRATDVPPPQGVSSLEGIINRNAQTEVNPSMDTGNLSNNLQRVAGQKGMTFGSESPLGPGTQDAVKVLLGQIARSLQSQGQ